MSAMHGLQGRNADNHFPTQNQWQSSTQAKMLEL